MNIKLFLLLIIISFSGFSQLIEDHTVALEVGANISSTNENPFWLRSNKNGVIPMESNSTFLEASINKSAKRHKDFYFDYKLTSRAILGKNVKKIVLPEAYVATEYKAFRIMVGREIGIQGLVDSTLSSGAFSWSGNSLPIPKVDISIKEYTPLLLKGLISIKGNYAHGWFGSTDSVSNYYLHQKSFYTRIGKKNWKFKTYAGFNHQAQWGGAPTVPFTNNGNLITKYNSSLENYAKVVTGVSLNKDGDGATTDDPLNEALNRAGNHLGTVDLAFEFAGKNSTLMLYKQSYFEDGSLFYLSNLSDGVYGLSISRKDKLIDKIVFEYIDTKNQGGSYGSKNNIGELRGKDNYFNNPIYKDGWEYKGNVIGTPFINKNSDLQQNKEFNQYTDKVQRNFKINNRVSALYFSLQLNTKSFTNSFKASFSNSLGNYSNPVENLSQFSCENHTTLKLKNRNQFSLNIGLDKGQLWKNSIGVISSYKITL